MTEADPSDLTARARIRDAALRQFGEHGFDGATIRGIAEAAGVSSGLLRHHFGSKAELRDACDAHLATVLADLDRQARRGDTDPARNDVAAAVAALGPYRDYLVRALTEGRAETVFDAMVDLSTRWLAESDAADPNPADTPRAARAAVGTAMALAIPILHKQLSRSLGVDVLDAEGAKLLARVLLDVYSRPWISPDAAARYRADLDGGAEQV